MVTWAVVEAAKKEIKLLPATLSILDPRMSSWAKAGFDILDALLDFLFGIITVVMDKN